MSAAVISFRAPVLPWTIVIEDEKRFKRILRTVLGILALLGSRVPVSLKVFLTALAIIDDLGAVAIIALLYTADLSVLWLALAGAVLLGLWAMNRAGVIRLTPYVILGVLLWYFVLRSGVHATLAGVALALTIPIRCSPGRPDDEASPLHRLEHQLQPWVGYLIVPLFGFAKRRTLMRTPVTRADIVEAAHGLLAADGVPVSMINDSAGFVAQRVVAHIVNVGCDIAQMRIASPEDLDRIPAEATESFAGVGYYFQLADVRPGETVVDLGSGSGMDSFIAALKVGEAGEAFLKVNASALAIVRKVLWWVIRLTPIGTVGLFGNAVAQYGWTALGQLGAFTGAIYIGLALVLLVVYPTILALNGLNPVKFFQGAWPAIQLGFVSRSSVGTLPVTEAVTETIATEARHFRERLRSPEAMAAFAAFLKK